jgi:hypothetical protein
MASQKVMSTPPSQPSLENLLTFGIESRKKHMWRMDQKTLEQILGFQMNFLFFLRQPNRVIPNKWK